MNKEQDAQKKELVERILANFNLQVSSWPIGKRLHQLKGCLESLKEVSKW